MMRYTTADAGMWRGLQSERRRMMGGEGGQRTDGRRYVPQNDVGNRCN